MRSQDWLTSNSVSGHVSLRRDTKLQQPLLGGFAVRLFDPNLAAISRSKTPGTHQVEVVLRRKPGLSHLPKAAQDLATLRNHAGATILREAEGDLPGFPSPAVIPQVPLSRYRRVDLAVAAAR